MRPAFINVGQLIEKLQKVDPRASVWIPDEYPWPTKAVALNVVLARKPNNSFYKDGSPTEDSKYGEIDLCHDDGGNDIYPTNHGETEYIL